MRLQVVCLSVSMVFLLTILSPLVQPTAADPPGAGDPPTPPGPGPIESSGGGAGGGAAPGLASYLPSSQSILNGTQVAGDCGTSWTALNASDDIRCSYQEADKSPVDQTVVLLPDGNDVDGWTAAGCIDQQNPGPYDELDDGPDTHDGDATCRQGSGTLSVGVTLKDPVLSDPSDVDDFNVVTSAVVKKVSSQGASIAIDLKVGTSSYNQGSAQSTTTSYVRYSRTDAVNPISGAEWDLADIEGLVGAVRCVDCSPNNRATQLQAKVDAFYNPEYALEVRYQWSGIPVQADGWYLVAECQRNTTAMEVVGIQVGQGGNPPATWKTAFWCSSNLDETFDPYPLSAAELNSGTPIVRLWDLNVDSPDDVSQGIFGVDVLRVDVAPWATGLARVAYQQPLNISRDYANYTIDPVLAQPPGMYTYVTSYGNYTFPASSPYLFSMFDLDARESANASTFVVEGTPATAISGAYVASANNTTFRVFYNVTSGPTFQGTMEIKTVFSATARPKLTAIFNRDPAATITNWRIRWKVVTTDHYLQRPGDTTLEFGGFGTPTLVESNPEAVIGPLANPALWNSSLIANWSDVGAGSLYVGPVSVDGNHSGQGILVDFPLGLATIDPSMVAKSGTYWATRYTNQKKVFFHGGNFFAFFRNSLTFPIIGSIPLISYASGRESGESPTGMTWDSPTTVVLGAFKWSFDVDHRNGVVALAWVDSEGILKVKLGNVAGPSIVWRGESILNLRYNTYVPSIAVGTDGFIWVAMPHDRLSLKVEVWRSAAPEDSTAFLSSLTIPIADIKETVRLVPLPGGNVMLLRAPYASSAILFRTFVAVSNGWTAEGSTQGLWLQPNSEKVSAWTAVGDVDAQGNQVARLLVVDSSASPSFLKIMRYTVYAFSCPPPGVCPPPIQIDTGSVSYPAVQVDLNGDLHYFWAKEGTGCSNCRRIQYQRVDVTGTTTGILQPFATGQVAADSIHLSTGFGAQLNRAFLVYTDPAAPGIQVFFASLPTRRAVGGGGGAPWERPGIGPHGTYFQQLDEFVSPGNGLLYIKQVDLSAPGVGLDLAIERLFRTPDAFFVNPPSTTEVPWEYHSPSEYSFGRGWSLNVPSLVSGYLYLWDGQRFPITWRWNVFENRDGEYFRLVRETGGYVRLDTRSGVSYEFVSNQLKKIYDQHFNQINLFYSVDGLDYISDARGGTADFDYTPSANPSCPGNTVKPSRVCKITYGGRTVKYGYAGDQLTSVIDPLGRTTTYAYCSSGCSAITNGWLIKQVQYATGARSEYEYASVKVGTDASAYVTTKQLLRDAGGQVVRKKTLEYDVVNGAVANVKITYYDGPGAVQRSEMYNMDALKGSMSTFQFDAIGTKRNGQKAWFGPGGRIVQSDVFMGASAADSLIATYSTYAHYDDYGNLLYTRSATGSESLSSYVNSNYHGAFYAPGRLELVPPPPGQSAGKVWVDDFRDYTFSDWTLSSSGTKSLDSLTFGSLPPSLKLETTPTMGQAWAKHGFQQQSQSAGFVTNILVKPATSDRVHDIYLKSGGVIQIYLWFDLDSKFKYTGGSAPWPSYGGGNWYLVTVEVLPGTGRYNLYLNGQPIGLGSFLIAGSGSFDEIQFVAGASGTTTTMWINEVAVFTGNTLRVEDIQAGMQGGTRVRVLSGVTGKQLEIESVASGTATITLAPHYFPHVVVQVLNMEWGVVYTSPSREFWGGSTLKFVEPRIISDLTKVSSGFLRSAWVWVDDSMPGGTETNDPPGSWPFGEGGWWWSSPDSATAASGPKYHESRPRPGRHGHGFKDAPPTPLPGADDYWIQYVYLQPNTFPAEILRAFQHSSTGQYHRAFWGGGGDPNGLDGLGGGPFTGFRQVMGSIPEVTDRWIMLIVKQRHIQGDPNGAPNAWKGGSYYVVGGGARWDFTARGDTQTGKIRVSGLPPGATARLYDLSGILKASAPESGGVADLALYDVLDSFRNAFPARGYFEVWDAAGTSLYRSPIFDIFGGDEFQYTATQFYRNLANADTIKDRLAGLYRVQERDANGNPSIVQKTFLKYQYGDLLETKVVGPNGPVVVSSRTYDSKGNVLTATTLYDDSNSHVTSYEYNSLSPYLSGFLTKVSDTVGGSPIETNLDYESGGEMKSVTPPLGGTTSYGYDAVGRPLTLTHPDTTLARNEYYDAARLVVVKDENYNAQTQKRQSWQCYDSIGRLTKVYRFGDAGSPSSPSCTPGDFISEILRPNGPGSSTLWSRVGCSANWECLDEAAPDNDATYVWDTIGGQADLYAMQNLAVVNNIASVTVRAVVYGTPACNPEPPPLGCAGLLLLVNGYTSRMQLADTTYGKVSYTWATNPATGLAWTSTELDALEAGVKKVRGTEVRVTQLEVEVAGWRSPYYSSESYEYDWQDRVVAYIAPRGPGETGRRWTRAYDFVGRLTRVTNPDGTYIDIAYDDATNTKTVTVTTDVQNTRKTEYVSDWDGRLKTAREWIGSTPYSTTYTYDVAGNLKTTTTPADATGVQQTTSHEYEGVCPSPPCDSLGRLSKTTYPDGTNEQYGYFNSGLLKWKQLRDGTRTTYTYDELRRLNLVCWDDTDTACSSGEEEWDYDYDANGNLAKLKFNTWDGTPVVLDYAYVLPRGWVDTEKYTVNGIGRTVDYDYDNVGNVLRIRVDDPTANPTTVYDVQYAYDAFDRVCAVVATAPGGCAPTSYYTKLSYTTGDLLDTITYGNGVTTKHTYDLNARPLSIETRQGTNPPYLRMDYEDYDTLGDPLRIKYTGQGLTTTYECFTYDALGRLATARTATSTGCSWAAAAWTFDVAYSYDPLGNRRTASGESPTDYLYTSYSRLCATKVGTPAGCTDPAANRYSYNARGEMTQRVLGTATWTFSWPVEGQLAGVNGPNFVAGYVHDGLGRRVKSNVDVGAGATTTVYVFSGLSPLVERATTGGTTTTTKYVYAAGLRVARIDNAGAVQYYQYDHLGSVRLVTSSAGTVLTTLAYKPFGTCTYGCESEPNYGYTGEYRESTPNLIYLHSRWYDPTIGRFLSADDRLGKQSMPQDQNRYSYVMNNPLAYTDPTGHFIWFVFLAVILLAATANAVLYGATCGSSCSIGGFAGAFVTGAITGAVAYLTAGLGLGAVIALSMAENVAGYVIMSIATGQEITAAGLLLNAAAGAAFGFLGFAAGRMRAAAKPANGVIGHTVSGTAMAGDDALKAARNTARQFTAVDKAGRIVGFPERSVNYMWQKGHFSHIMSKFKLSSLDDVFGRVRHTIENAVPSVQGGRLVYELDNLRVIVQPNFEGYAYAVYNAYPFG